MMREGMINIIRPYPTESLSEDTNSSVPSLLSAFKKTSQSRIWCPWPGPRFVEKGWVNTSSISVMPLMPCMPSVASRSVNRDYFSRDSPFHMRDMQHYLILGNQ